MHAFEILIGFKFRLMRLPDGEADGTQHDGFGFDNALIKIDDAFRRRQRVFGVRGQLVQQPLIFLDALLDRAPAPQF